MSAASSPHGEGEEMSGGLRGGHDEVGSGGRSHLCRVHGGVGVVLRVRGRGWIGGVRVAGCPWGKALCRTAKEADHAACAEG